MTSLTLHRPPSQAFHLALVGRRSTVALSTQKHSKKRKSASKSGWIVSSCCACSQRRKYRSLLTAHENSEVNIEPFIPLDWMRNAALRRPKIDQGMTAAVNLHGQLSGVPLLSLLLHLLHTMRVAQPGREAKRGQNPDAELGRSMSLTALWIFSKVH